MAGGPWFLLYKTHLGRGFLSKKVRFFNDGGNINKKPLEDYSSRGLNCY